MAKKISQVNFRMPTDLKEKLEEISKKNERSLTSEVINRLEESFTIKDKQPIYFSENNSKAINTLITLSLENIIKNLIVNGVNISIIRKSFPSEGVFKEIIDSLEDSVDKS